MPENKSAIFKNGWKRFTAIVRNKKLIGFCIVVVIFPLMLIGCVADRLIFPYSKCSYEPALTGLRFMESNDNLQIATRFWPAKNERGLILYFHGNGEDLGHLDSKAATFTQHNFSVLSMDYRGYGLSEGTPSEQHCYDDAQLLYEAAQKMGYSSEKIIIWGRSVGSGPATELALQQKAKTLVLESPFSSTFRVVTKVAILPFDRFDNLSKIDQIDEPLFILHGDADKVIPSWHSESLFEKHTGKKERHLIPQAGHNNLWDSAPNKLFERFEQFLLKSESDAV